MGRPPPSPPCPAALVLVLRVPVRLLAYCRRVRGVVCGQGGRVSERSFIPSARSIEISDGAVSPHPPQRTMATRPLSLVPSSPWQNNAPHRCTMHPSPLTGTISCGEVAGMPRGGGGCQGTHEAWATPGNRSSPMPCVSPPPLRHDAPSFPSPSPTHHPPTPTPTGLFTFLVQTARVFLPFSQGLN